MNTQMTQQQIEDQQVRFNNLMGTINLVKAGAKIMNFRLNDSIFSGHDFILRYLKFNGINPNMYKPDTLTGRGLFYSELFEAECISAYLESI